MHVNGYLIFRHIKWQYLKRKENCTENLIRIPNEHRVSPKYNLYPSDPSVVIYHGFHFVIRMKPLIFLFSLCSLHSQMALHMHFFD